MLTPPPLHDSALASEDDFRMTMRDYFAAAALNALLSKPPGSESQTQASYAEIAYAYADAMLVARSTGLL